MAFGLFANRGTRCWSVCIEYAIGVRNSIACSTLGTMYRTSRKYATVTEKNNASASISIHSTTRRGMIASHVQVGKYPYAKHTRNRMAIEIRKSADDEITAPIGNTSRGQ